jgi:hypothetical protein
LKSNLWRDYAVDLEFIAVNFRKFPPESFSALPFDLVYGVSSHRRLKIQNEDSLFDFIISDIGTNPVYFSLLEFVRFEHLSSDQVSQAIMHSSPRFTLACFSQFHSPCPSARDMSADHRRESSVRSRKDDCVMASLLT